MFNSKLGNLASLMKNAGKIKDMMESAQGELDKIEIDAEAGAGMVKVKMTAKGAVKDLFIDDELLKEDKEVMVDLIKAAINDGQAKGAAIMQEKMSGLSDFLGE